MVKENLQFPTETHNKISLTEQFSQKRNMETTLCIEVEILDDENKTWLVTIVMNKSLSANVLDGYSLFFTFIYCFRDNYHITMKGF